MTVDRTRLDRQTRYELRDDTGLACVLTFAAPPEEPATWQILLPGPGGAEDLYGTHRTSEPDASWLQNWLTAVIGGDRAAEMTAAVDADPPPAAGWA